MCASSGSMPETENTICKLLCDFMYWMNFVTCLTLHCYNAFCTLSDGTRRIDRTLSYSWETILLRSTDLTHWGRVTHICVGKLTIIGSDNGLSPERRQAIIWTNDGILLIGPLGTNSSENLIEIQTFSLKKIRLKMSSAKCCSFRLDRPQCVNDRYEETT